MNCKNCQNALIKTSSFCANCGAKIVTDRISIKNLWKSFVDQVFGWDNKYFFTLKALLLTPESVFKEYLNGTRKKYVAPFTFLAIGTALAMLVFNSFSANYLKMANSLNETQFEIVDEQFDQSENSDKLKKQRIEQIKMGRNIQKTILKYFNIFTFLLIPLYALIAYWVFGKPYNYGEHLIIACYSQGFLFLISVLFFGLSLAINPSIYSASILIAISYYLYVYKNLYSYPIGKLLVKLLKFIGILFLVLLTFSVIGFLFQVLKHKLG